MITILSQAGLVTLILLLLAAGLRPLVGLWLKERIRAGIDEAVKRRLASLQLDLDKDLERHRAELTVAGEHIRSSLARVTSDFVIYAHRRHDAVSTLFANSSGARRLPPTTAIYATHPIHQIHARISRRESFGRGTMHMRRTIGTPCTCPTTSILLLSTSWIRSTRSSLSISHRPTRRIKAKGVRGPRFADLWPICRDLHVQNSRAVDRRRSPARILGTHRCS